MPQSKSLWIILPAVLGLVGLAIYVVLGTQALTSLATAGFSDSKSGNENIDGLEQIGTIKDSELSEISGIVESKKFPGHFWVHNDSGNSAAAYLISSDGRTRLKVNLVGARNVDWEDICRCEIKGESWICIGDVGDNAALRKGYQLYRFCESRIQWDPATEKKTVLDVREFQVSKFMYEDGSRNCEAIMFDNQQQCLYLFQKAKDRHEKSKQMGIYQIRFTDGQPDSTTAKRVGAVTNKLVTGGDMLRDGTRVVLCGYVAGALMERNEHKDKDWNQLFSGSDTKFHLLPLPFQRQGEAICFTDDGESVIVVSEFRRQPIWKLKVKPKIEK